MHNDRPIEDINLQQGLNEVKAVMERRGLAGACMLVTAEEAAYTYGLHAPWSAIRPDAATPLGFRIRAVSAELGPVLTRARVEGALHTVAQLRDFGEQTVGWMEQLLAMLRKAGIDFTHRSHGGRPLPELTARDMLRRPGGR